MLPVCCHPCQSCVLMHESFWIWIFWSNTSSFGHELIFCCSLCMVYIGTRSSESIDFSDMLEDCNNLQLRNFSKELNSWVKLFVRRNIGDIDLFWLRQLRQDSARGWCGYRNAATLDYSPFSKVSHYRFYQCQPCYFFQIWSVDKYRYNLIDLYWMHQCLVDAKERDCWCMITQVTWEL